MSWYNPLSWFEPRRQDGNVLSQVVASLEPRAKSVPPPIISRSMMGAVSGMPNSRISVDNETMKDMLGRMESRFVGYQDNTPFRIIQVLRMLSEFDEDVHGSVRDMATLVNAGHTIEFIGNTRAVQQARAEIEIWSKGIYEEGGGVDAFITNQAQELIISGASAVEWFPRKNKKGVQDVSVIQGEYIKRLRMDDNTWQHFQTQTIQGEIELSPLTFRYFPLRLAGHNPYGVPLIISALEAVDRKQKLLKAEMRVINAMSMIALVTATLPPPPDPEDVGCESEIDPKYTAYLSSWANDAADLISQGAEKGLYLAQAGTEIKLTSIAKSGEGMNDIQISNNRRVWTALRTLPMMRGWMDSTTEALAKVIYPILEADAGSIQLILAQVYSFGINLHLRLMGNPTTAYVHFDQPDSPFAITHAQMELARAQTDEILKRVFGDAWAIHAMRRNNVRLDDDSQAPDWWQSNNTAPGSAQQPDKKLPSTGVAYLFMSKRTGSYRAVESMNEAWLARQEEKAQSLRNTLMQETLEPKDEPEKVET